MDTASGKSQDLQEDSDYSLSVSNLTFWVDKGGSIQYNMDWEEGENGIYALSQIFYEIIHNDFTVSILTKMKEQCVLNGTELEFESFLKLVNYHLPNSDLSSEVKDFRKKPLISPDKSAYTI
jgi:hypothetical protein